MKFLWRVFSLGSLATLASPLVAQDTTPDDAIEFCDDLVIDFRSLNHDISPDGNLFVIPSTKLLNEPGFTAVKYFGTSQDSVITEYFPSQFTGVSGVVAFAGNTLLYAGPLNPVNDFRSVHVTLFDYDPSTGNLVESQTLELPTTENVVIGLHPTIDAEDGQFVVENGNIDGDSRVCIYRFNGTAWVLDGTIDRSVSTFVTALAIEGDTLVIGYSDEVVQLYTRDSVNGWEYDQAITAEMNDVTTSRDFGETIEINGNWIAVGAPGAKVFDSLTMDDQRSGAVFMYDYTAGVVTHQETLFEHDGTDDPGSGRSFGHSIDFSDDGGLLIVGADQFDTQANWYSYIGASFLYDTSDMSMYEEMYYDDDLYLAGSSFGKSVRISGDLVSIVSLSYDASCGSSNKKAILLYETGLVSTPCNAADLAEQYGSLNFVDVSAFLQLYGVSDPLADLNNDGSWNFLDVSTFLSVYGAGCP